MPSKLLSSEQVPIQVVGRLAEWGAAIRTQRLLQKVRAADLCARAGLSEATLRRMERGDPTAGIGAVLSVLNILGLLDHAMPPLPEYLTREPDRVRVRLPNRKGDDDEF